MTAAAVALCNRALTKLAETHIASFEDGTDTATTCSTVFDGVVTTLEALHPWRHTLRKQQLSRRTTAPVSGWAYAHAAPPDMITLRALFPSAAVGAAPVLDFDRFGADILSNQPELWADYQTATDPSTWPPLFQELVVNALAADLAVPVTGSITAAELFHRRAFGTPQESPNGGLLRAARTAEAMQQPSRPLSQAPLIQARFGGRR